MDIKEFRDRLSFVLLCIYAFITPFGTLFRFSSKETALGVSSIILIVLIVSYFFENLYFFLKSKIFSLMLLLILWIFISSLFIFPNQNQTHEYINLSFLFLYTLFCISITRINFSSLQLKLFFFFLFLGISLSAGLTLIDFFGIIDVPFVNQLKIVTKVNGEEVRRATGFFMRRSAMAAYFSLVLPAFFVLFLTIRYNLLKIILIFGFFMSLLVLIFTHNLAGISAILISCLAYLFFGYNVSHLLKIKKILIVCLLLCAFILIIFVRFSEIIDVYMFRINAHNSNAPIATEELAKQKESDNERLYFLKYAINDIVRKPLGHGLSYISTDEYGLTDPHNMVTQIIWGAGIFSFFWFALFAGALKNVLRSRKNLCKELTPYFDALKYGLLSWLICGMAHNIIFTGLAWLFFGMILNIHHRYFITSKSHLCYSG